MPEDAKKKPGQDSPPKVPAWMVTFSDCMTLLLCFFVLLMTFSSFDDVKVAKLSGGLSGKAFESIFPIKRTIRNSVVAPKPRPLERTPEGSEQATDREQITISNPKRPSELFNTDAYRDRNQVSIPSGKLFFARGSGLTLEGKRMLGMVALFLKRMPCHVMIGETNSEGAAPASRALAVTEYLIKSAGIERNRFSISADRKQSRRTNGGRPTMVVTMLTGEFYK